LPSPNTAEHLYPDHVSPAAWFAVLESARHAGDFELAAKAHKKLRELGVEVRYRRPKREEVSDDHSDR